MAKTAKKALKRAPPADNDVSVVESIIDAIKDGIRSGRFAPGQRLIAEDMRGLVGAGRGSIREAMRRLSAEGYVDLEHQKGARVRTLTQDEAAGIYLIREMLEGLAARLAANNIDNLDFRPRLLALEAEFERTHDGTEASYLTYNLAFHNLIVEMGQISQLAQMVEQLQVPAFLMLARIMVTQETINLARAEHQPIVEAILAGDARRAETAMRTHIRRTGTSVLKRSPGLIS